MLSGVIPALPRLASSQGKLPKGAGVDKDTLPSRVDHQRVVLRLDYRLHKVCRQYRSDFSFRGRGRSVADGGGSVKPTARKASWQQDAGRHGR